MSPSSASRSFLRAVTCRRRCIQRVFPSIPCYVCAFMMKPEPHFVLQRQQRLLARLPLNWSSVGCRCNWLICLFVFSTNTLAEARLAAARTSERQIRGVVCVGAIRPVSTISHFSMMSVSQPASQSVGRLWPAARTTPMVAAAALGPEAFRSSLLRFCFLFFLLAEFDAVQMGLFALVFLQLGRWRRRRRRTKELALSCKNNNFIFVQTAGSRSLKYSQTPQPPVGDCDLRNSCSHFFTLNSSERAARLE